MKLIIVGGLQTATRVLLVSMFTLVFIPGTAIAQQSDFEDIVSELSSKLELDADQSSKLAGSIEVYANQLDTLFAGQEGEDADPALLINGVKDAQESFEAELASFMSKEQHSQYLELKEQAIKTMLSDLAEIQLIEVQSKSTISDEQVTELAPVLGHAFYNIIKIAWENAGKNLRVGQKISLAKRLKTIQRDLQRGLEQVLTDEQIQSWEAHKAQKNG
jgi:hypothetical protein